MGPKNMRVNLLLIVFLFATLKTEAQVSREFQQMELFGYNVLFGGITAGVGSAINKPRTVKLLPAFLKGFAFGALGGTINFAAKKTLYNLTVTKSYGQVYLSNSLSNVGNSIIYCAAMHRKPGSYWFYDLWFTRFELDLAEHDNSRFKVKILPNALISGGVYLNQKFKFDLSRSLQTGILTFTRRTNPDSYGSTFMRSIVTEKNIPKWGEHLVFAHEAVHYFQFREYAAFNTWLMPLAKIVPKVPKKIFSNWVYLDIPWLYAFYPFQVEKDKRFYFQNFYEYEAQFFATNKYVRQKQ